jgi:hypothetical protein
VKDRPRKAKVTEAPLIKKGYVPSRVYGAYATSLAKPKTIKARQIISNAACHPGGPTARQQPSLAKLKFMEGEDDH